VGAMDPTEFNVPTEIWPLLKHWWEGPSGRRLVAQAVAQNPGLMVDLLRWGVNATAMFVEMSEFFPPIHSNTAS
jgi:hypothetical protein